MHAFLVELSWLSFVYVSVIQLAVAATLGLLAYRHIHVPSTGRRVLSIFEGVAAILILLGVYTHEAALAATIAILIELAIPAYRALPRSTLALLLVLSISLIISGAGPFALLDMPL